MVDKIVYLGVNGIDNVPGRPRDWNARMVTYVHRLNERRLPDDPWRFGEKVQYYAGAITSRFWQRNRVHRLKVLLRNYLRGESWKIVLAGHSYGTKVILECLKQMDWPYIDEVHLMSGACESDFEKNGLNQALRERRIGKLVIYDAGRDSALQIAALWLGRVWGYGSLGLKGPIRAATDVQQYWSLVEEPTFGHSDWFLEGRCFEQTMKLITNT